MYTTKTGSMDLKQPLPNAYLQSCKLSRIGYLKILHTSKCPQIDEGIVLQVCSTTLNQLCDCGDINDFFLISLKRLIYIVS